MNCLHNDLFAVMDYQMNTLRNTVITALPMQWLNGELDSEFDLESVNELLLEYETIAMLNPDVDMELKTETMQNIKKILNKLEK